MKYFLLGVGSVVLVCLLLAAFPFTLSLMLSGPGFSEHTLRTLQEAQSPDGTHIATAYIDMGGGAAGWCAVEVNIRRPGTELPPNEDVFSARCSTEVKLSWGSSDLLTVEFTPAEADFSISHDAVSKDGSVKIRYVEGKASPN